MLTVNKVENVFKRVNGELVEVQGLKKFYVGKCWYTCKYCLYEDYTDTVIHDIGYYSKREYIMYIDIDGRMCYTKM